MQLGLYDYLTFAAILLIMIGVMAVVLFLLGLPGRIARKRQHPHTEAVNLLGWIGFLGGIPWIHALIWSIHPSVTVDIRRFPEEEREAILRELGITPDPETAAETGDAPDASGNGETPEEPS